MKKKAAWSVPLQYFVYHLRWQASALIMMAPLYFLETYTTINPYLRLMIIQFFGAIIFWWIDKLIFSKTKEKKRKKYSKKEWSTSFRYFVYHLRWQVSAVVMMAPLYFFETYTTINPYFRLMILQFFGAIIFWWIDKLIFSRNSA